MSHPSILLIIIDCGRADHVGAYGYTSNTTPTIDRLATEGIRFENAFSSAAWTLESVAALYTGLYSSQHGVDAEHPILGPQHTTLAGCLQTTHTTAAFSPGAWHGRRFGFARGFSRFQETYRRPDWLNRVHPTPTRPERVLRRLSRQFGIGWEPDKGARAITRAAKGWLASRPTDRPFFMVVHYIEPHLPYRIPEPFGSQFLPPGISKGAVRGLNQDAFKYMAGEVQMTKDDFAVLGALYDGALRYTDYQIEQLVSELENQRVLDSTLVIVLADHGENLGDHGLMDHQYSLHDTLLHIPLVMRLPGTVPAGVSDDRLAQNVDLFPTIVELLGGAIDGVPNDLRGESLLAGGRGREFTVSEYLAPVLLRFRRAHPRFDCSRFDRALRAIRTREHKLIWASDGVHELYQISTDSGEQHNLIEDQPLVADSLRESLQDWLASLRGPTGRSHSCALDPAVEDRLRHLGYI